MGLTSSTKIEGSPLAIEACKFVAMPVGCPVRSRSWLRDSEVGRQRLPVLLGCSTGMTNVTVFTKAMFESTKGIQRSQLLWLTRCSSPEPSSKVHPNQDISDAVSAVMKDVSHPSLDPRTRLHYTDSCEDAINKHIDLLYYTSYIYDSMFGYFDDDNVALVGFAKYFKEMSDHRRKRAEELMTCMKKKGGKVKRTNILLPEFLEFDNVLQYMEFSYSLEHNITDNSFTILKFADKDQDDDLSQFMKGQHVPEQIRILERISEYLRRLRLIGADSLGIYNLDSFLRKG